MILATHVMLHVGHGQVTLPTYLTVALLHFLAFAAIGIALWWYLNAGMVVRAPDGSAGENEADDERARAGDTGGG